MGSIGKISHGTHLFIHHAEFTQVFWFGARFQQSNNKAFPIRGGRGGQPQLEGLITNGCRKRSVLRLSSFGQIEATEHLEELFKLAYDDIAPGMPPQQVQLDGLTAAITTQVQIEATDPSSGYSYKRVTVEINWTFNDQAVEERFVTFISGRSEAP